jgi:excisionase family DNA binding protein
MERLLNVKQAGEKLSISVYTIRAWVAERRLPHVRLGRRVAFRPEDLEAFVKTNTVAARK